MPFIAFLYKNFSVRFLFLIKSLLAVAVTVTERPEEINSYPLGVWIEDANYEIVTNQKRGSNLIFAGYSYRREATFKSSINWICTKSGNNGCKGRIVQTTAGLIKLGKNQHNHPSTVSLPVCH